MKKKKSKKKNKSHLTAADVRRFRALLLIKRAEILGDISSMEAETLRKERSDLSNVPFHMADVGSDNFELENTLGLMDEEVKLLSQIDDALVRMEQRKYGICEGSGEPISKVRLEAIPWARYSFEYAQLLEKGLVQENAALSEEEDEEGQDGNELEDEEGLDVFYGEDEEEEEED